MTQDLLAFLIMPSLYTDSITCRSCDLTSQEASSSLLGHLHGILKHLVNLNYSPFTNLVQLASNIDGQQARDLVKSLQSGMTDLAMLPSDGQ